VIHGHSSHHVKALEVHRQKLILYGCGDFVDDYEGISGYEEFRDDLVLMYFPVVHAADGTLAGLDMVRSRYATCASTVRLPPIRAGLATS
jgi:poly-gamma-glutamate synthesis protein (capsule biosynthesis protein)